MYNETQQLISRYHKRGKFQTSVANGNVDGWGVVHKFGEGTADTTFKVIYDNMLNADYPFLIDTNLNMTIQSTDALDVGQTIRVFYVEYNASNQKWEYKVGLSTTNGLTSVTLKEVDADDNEVGDANVMIPYRMINEGAGTTFDDDLVGTLTLENTGTVYAQIDNGNNQTLMALFPICDDYKAVIHSIGRSVIGVNKNAEFHYKYAEYGQPSQVKRTVTLSSDSNFENFEIPFVFGKGILTVEAKIGTGTALVSAWWDMNLIEADKF